MKQYSILNEMQKAVVLMQLSTHFHTTIFFSMLIPNSTNDCNESTDR